MHREKRPAPQPLIVFYNNVSETYSAACICVVQVRYSILAKPENDFYIINNMQQMTVWNAQPNAHETGNNDLFAALTDARFASFFARSPCPHIISKWHGHVPFAFWLMNALRPGIFVSVGTHDGVAYTAFCESARANLIKTKCFAANFPPTHDDAEFFCNDSSPYVTSYHAAHYTAFSQLLRLPADAPCRGFTDGSVDLLHISGSHSYHALRDIFETWKPKLSRQSVIVIDDVSSHADHSGSRRFWAELITEYPGFEFIHENGLGILAFGVALPMSVHSLCTTNDPAVIAMIRMRFAQAGDGCAAASERARLRMRADEDLAATQALELTNAKHETTRLLAVATAGETALHTRQTALNAAQRELASTQFALDNARTEVSAAQEALARMQADLDLQKQQDQQQIQDLRNAFDAITQSTIWRALAPARRLGQQLPAPLRRVIRRALKTVWLGQRPRPVQAAPPPALAQPDLPPPSPATNPEPPATDMTTGRFETDLIPPLTGNTQPRLMWYDPDRPDVSIIVVNWNRGAMTLLCLQHLWEATTGHRYEIIVVDNGSNAEELAWLRDEAPLVRIIALGANKFFGEANNIAVEAARGHYICLLNNDAFVTPGWLPPLVETLATNSKIGAVGPSFRYPDGSLQEAGVIIDPAGYVIQLGKGGDADDPLYNTSRTVDYISAACLLLRRSDYLRVLGFDRIWEPAYYEDTDLCLKLRLIGLATQYCPTSQVIHIENATISTQKTSFDLDTILATNRVKFVARWGRFLATMGAERPNLLLSEPVSVPRHAMIPDPRILIYTPDEITASAAAAYLMAIALAFKDRAEIVLAAPGPLSRLRFLTIGRDLGFDLQHVHLITPEQLSTQAPFHLAFVAGREIFPPVGRLAARNIFICQALTPLPSQDHAKRTRPFWNDFELVLTSTPSLKTEILAQMDARNLPARPINVEALPVTSTEQQVFEPKIRQIGFDLIALWEQDDIAGAPGMRAPAPAL
jgi:GT2 family glycosyltransferase